MRRKNQQLSSADCNEILLGATSGVLALDGDDGYPYAVPLNFVYEDGKIFFHCAKSGHKIDSIKRSNKASFCIIAKDDVRPDEYTSYYKSVIAFGKIRILTDETQKRRAINLLSVKYNPHGREEDVQREINLSYASLCMLELEIERLTGKQAKELINKGREEI